MIYLTSDLHFNHGKEFIWKARGFSSVEEMNEEIIKRWNNVVKPEDEVYIAGDLMLGDTDKGIALVNRLNGFKRIIIGNHDTDNRVEAYKIGIKNLLSIEHATRFRYGKNVFWVSHYAADTSNYDDQKAWVKNLINLYGHTHQQTNFYQDILNTRNQLDVQILSTDLTRINTITPTSGNKYYVIESNTLWLYNNKWIVLDGVDNKFNGYYYTGGTIAPTDRVDVLDNNGLLRDGSVCIRDARRLIKGKEYINSNNDFVIASYLGGAIKLVPSGEENGKGCLILYSPNTWTGEFDENGNPIITSADEGEMVFNGIIKVKSGADEYEVVTNKPNIIEYDNVILKKVGDIVYGKIIETTVTTGIIATIDDEKFIPSEQTQFIVARATLSGTTVYGTINEDGELEIHGNLSAGDIGSTFSYMLF